jgi:hypothetical protein
VLAEVKEEEASELLAVVLAVPGLCVLGVGVWAVSQPMTWGGGRGDILILKKQVRCVGLNG